MKATVLQENLRAGLGKVSRIVSSRPQLPILANILIEAKDGKLRLTGTDLELGVQVELGAKIEVEGKTTVPAKTFFDFVTSIPSGKVELELKEEKLLVASGRYKASFQVIPADEFPQFPTINDHGDNVIEFNSEQLKSALQKIVYAAAKDSMRPILTGVLFELKGKRWRVVATDGFRLALNEGKLDKEVEEELEIVVPGRAIGELMKLEGDGFRLVVLKESNQVVFQGGEGILISQVLEGNYPNYRKIIPKEAKVKILISRESLAEGVGVSQVFAKNNSNILKWLIEKDGIRIKSESPELGENEVSLEARVEGEGEEIAFNGRFLLDFLQNSKAEEIEIGLGGSLAPGSFREKGNEDFLYIVMPINL